MNKSPRVLFLIKLLVYTTVNYMQVKCKKYPENK